MKRVDNLANFTPFINFIQSLPNDHTAFHADFSKRTNFINAHLIPYRAVWDCFMIDEKTVGSTDLIFDTEEAYTWFVLKWS